MSQSGSDQALDLGGCLFDRSRGLLLRDGEPVALRPKAFALLAHLAEHRDRVLTKSDLIAAVWPGVFVTEDSLTQAVREIRMALGDEKQTIVRTIARRGYLLASARADAFAADRQPTIAVLRFTNAGEPSAQPVIDGFTDDLINGLALFRTVTVLARSSSFAFGSDLTTDWQAVGRKLGAQFLVRGRLRLSADHLDAKIALIDAVPGSILWSHDCSASGLSIFNMQDEIAERILNRLISRLADAVGLRSKTKSSSNLAAYELLQRGLVRLRGYSQEDNRAARKFFRAALVKDPEFALAHAYHALADLAIGGYGEASPAILASSVNMASQAVSLAPEEPRCHRVLALARLSAREHEAAEYHLRRSVELNPYDADTMAQMGYLLTMRGKPVEALAWLDRAARVNPIHPDWYHYDRAMALYSAGEYEAAVASLVKLPVKTAWRLTRLAACHAQLGDLHTARALIAEVVDTTPNFSPIDFACHGVAFEHAADVEHLVEGVAKALAALDLKPGFQSGPAD